MKTIGSKYLFRLLLLISCCLNTAFAHAGTSETDEIRLVLSADWGKPAHSRYTAVNETSEWRYTRKYATLIVTRTKCVQCQPVSREDVDAYNDAAGPAMKAIMVDHPGGPGMLRFYASPKGVFLRTLQIVTGGFHYEVQLGIDRSAPHDIAFGLELEFLEAINRFQP